MRDAGELRFAVLIDADNAPRRSLSGILSEMAVHGTPTIKRIYGDWTSPNLGGWKKSLLEHAVTPIQQYGYTTGKNATDSAMIIDAMDILYAGQVDGFCLVSSDSDFTRLATRLREAGMKVFGMGERKTPMPFIVACDKFIYLEVLNKVVTVTDAPVKKAAGKRGAKASKVAAAAQVLQPAEQEAEEEHENEAEQVMVSTQKPVVPQSMISLIAATIEDVADDEGWAYLGEVGSLLQKKKTDFDARNYGFKKLTLMIEALDTFELDFRKNTQQNNGKLIFVRVKRT